MAYDISNNTAYIDGSTGLYCGKPKSAKYGANAMQNYHSYIRDFKTDTTVPNPDAFAKGASINSIRKMEKEVKKLENEKLPPLILYCNIPLKWVLLKHFLPACLQVLQ